MDEEYENSKFLYLPLKVRNLNDINDLHHFQNLCLLCKIVKNSFEIMHKMHCYNPKRFNSASSFSGYFERDTFVVIIALPTANKTVEVFEKIISGGFSCINTRLGLDV